MSYETSSASANYSFGSAAATSTNPQTFTSIVWWGCGDENDEEEKWVQFKVDTTNFNNTLEWNGWWVTVKSRNFDAAVQLEFRCIDHPTSDTFTANYAPLCEEAEVAPKEFAKFLERLGQDDEYIKIQAGRQQQLFEHEGLRGMWEPKTLEEIEASRVKMQRYLDLLEEEERKRRLERWNIETLPPMTPELLDQIATKSRDFLTQFLSPAELEMFVKDNHIKIQSQLEPDVVYIVKKGPASQIEKWKNDKHIENLCYISAWEGLPGDDITAMRIFDLKHNEAEVLKVANHFRS